VAGEVNRAYLIRKVAANAGWLSLRSFKGHLSLPRILCNAAVPLQSARSFEEEEFSRWGNGNIHWWEMQQFGQKVQEAKRKESDEPPGYLEFLDRGAAICVVCHACGDV
jgi:hypothetical protein